MSANAELTLGRVRQDGGDAFKIVGDTAIKADCQRAVEEIGGRAIGVLERESRGLRGDCHCEGSGPRAHIVAS